ncbi:MAG: hypothetical protein Q9219_006942 [cf. Caloplaca sp. 3 TL-2023]
MLAASKVSDWGEQQSSDSSGATYPQDVKVDGTNSAALEPTRTYTRPRQNMDRVYSIAALLEIGRTSQLAGIKLRISPAALGENIFKAASTALRSKLQENVHPRRQAQSSTITDPSTTSEGGITTYIHPIRQPFNPPEVPPGVPLSQKHAGFARFLKQHASPPHQRVTAGGRIVPAGPLAPPPMMVLPSINSVINNSGKHDVAGSSNISLEAVQKASNKLGTFNGPSATPLAQQNINVNAQKPPGIPQLANQGIDSLMQAHYAQIQPPSMNQASTYLAPLPLPAGATPMGFLPDGSSIVFLNGTNYQTFWNGSGIVLKPLIYNYQAPVVSPTSFAPTSYPQTGLTFPLNSSYVTGSTVLQQSEPSGLSTNVQGQLQQLDSTQPGILQPLQSQLSSELDTLDRFAALHLHEFSQAQTASYRSRRRELVEQLDSMRIGREQNGPSRLLSVPSHGTHSGPPNQPTPSQASNHKCLSPDAPPFVPAGIKTAASNYFASHQDPPSRSQPWVDDPLPTVTLADVEYTNRLDFNPQNGPKLYCTTIGEFQEVLRRVREQASMYGCQGGQSKDPAYDAEQDVRWAMADGEPIPLPKSPADHVANPRPWSWDDSAFNPRPQVVINPLRTKNRLVHRAHQRSDYVTGNDTRSHMRTWDTGSGKERSVTDPTVIRRSAYSTSDRSSRSPFRGGPPSGIRGMHRSGSQSYANHMNAADGRTNVAIADQTTNEGLAAAPLQQPLTQNERQEETRRRTVGNNKAFNHQQQQYRSFLNDAPKPAPTFPVRSGHQTFAREPSGRSDNVQQVRVPAHGTMSHSGQIAEGREVKRKDSWYSEAGSDDSWFSVSDKVSRSFTTSKHPETPSRAQQQPFHQSPQVYGQNPIPTAHSTPAHNNWQRADGPRDRESDALSFDSQGIPRADYHSPGISAPSSVRAARVNLPQADHHSILAQGFQTPSRGVRNHIQPPHTIHSFVKLPSDSSSEGFLRGMLKSPRYSAAKTYQSEPYDSTPYQIPAPKSGKHQLGNQYAKENIKSDGHQDISSWMTRGSSRGSQQSFGHYRNNGSDTVIGKARSSLAASTYQAFGQLPQYDGAGDALMSSNNHGRTTNGQTNGSSSQRRGGRTSQTRPSETLSNGERATRAEQARSYDVGHTVNYDYRGILRKDFTAAPDHSEDVYSHHAAVDRYFDRIHQQESQELAGAHGAEPIGERRL